MSKFRETAELVGIAAIVASLIFVGLELNQSREIALAAAKDATTEGFRELNFARMNADWYWETVTKLNSHLREPPPYRLGIPVSTTKKWKEALAQLSPEEFARFQSLHLQEMNEARRIYERNDLGLYSVEADPVFLVSIRAPLWTALFDFSEDSEFSRAVIESANGR
jgi:hypothetical protein